MAVHLPVMVREVVEMLNLKLGGVYVDATVGPGGHSEEILRHIGDGRLVCLDRDEDALGTARQRLGDGNCIYRKAKLSEMATALKDMGVSRVDGVLMDLGLSMLQMRSPERGFSFSSDEALDMRMDRSGGPTAADIVNGWPEAEIARILWEYGEERHSRRIARAIARARRAAAVRTCAGLADIVRGAVPGRGRVDPATRTFQALRIAVNDELKEVQYGLVGALSALATGGRMVVISYHSLEDRAVKNFMRQAKREGTIDVLTKKPLTPGKDELRANPSARSARLRAAEAT